jgi:HAMP domain-containing protein
MLASLSLAALILVGARTITLLASMMRASVLLVGVWLSLDRDVEVLARLADSVDQNLIAVWPLAVKLLLLVVLGEGVFGDFVIEESSVCGSVGVFADWVCAFDFGVLEAADAVVVVIDGCLEDCISCQPYSLYHHKPSQSSKVDEE